MFKKFVLAATALAMVVIPTAGASAQSWDRGDRYERRDDRYDRRDDRRDRRYDRRAERRDDRYDRRDDRRDRRWDRRDDRRHDRWDRNNRDWWRGHSYFRGYDGRRNGYYYAPGYGYYRVEPRYYNRRWARGQYVPAPYRRYYVQDPYFYGLRPAPAGYRWIYVDNDLVLASIATGLILDVLLDVY